MPSQKKKSLRSQLPRRLPPRQIQTHLLQRSQTLQQHLSQARPPSQPKLQLLKSQARAMRQQQLRQPQVFRLRCQAFLAQATTHSLQVKAWAFLAQ
jgi:hypothetical protein